MKQERRLEGAMREKFNIVKQELLLQPGIASVTASSENPLDIGSSTHTVAWRGKDPDSQILMTIPTDFDFLEVMQMQLIKGKRL